jgi:DNA-binding response OmpR family regulator
MDKKKVLFVDDDRFLLDMYAIKFTKAGYEARTADSSELALKILREGFVPDILLVDIIMPGMDGLTFMEMARKESLAPAATLVFLTNQGEPDDVARARKLGADGYIVKATTIPSEVLAEVEKIYKNKNAARA